MVRKTTNSYLHFQSIARQHDCRSDQIRSEPVYHPSIAMVVALGPGKFYGSSLPRPRIYDNSGNDLHLNDERIDPPLPVTDPLLSWANDAHWSMGGLSFKRQRLQGKIEGSIKRLRAAEEQEKRKSARNPNKKGSTAAKVPPLSGLIDSDEDGEPTREASPEIEVSRPLRRLRRGKEKKNSKGTVEKNDTDADADADVESSPIRDASPEIEVSRPMRRLKKKRSAIENNGTDDESSPVAAGFGVSTRARTKREGDDLENVHGKSASVSPKLRASPRIAKDKRIKS